MAVLTASLTRLRADVNEVFPARLKTSDGWIGDARHRLSTSAHNPDDTAGSKSEGVDADTRAEVRGLDLDKDLRDPRGVTMQHVVDWIIKTPADRKRLTYVIYRRRIASAKAGWLRADGSVNWRAYSGDNPHDEHVHFSGDPRYDEDGSPWQSVRDFKQQQQEAVIMALEPGTFISQPGGTGGGAGWDTPPAEWSADGPGVPEQFSVLFGGMFRRVYLLFQGLLYVSRMVTKVDGDLAALAARPVGTVVLDEASRAAIVADLKASLAPTIGEVVVQGMLDDRVQARRLEAAQRAERE